jgi:murein DD-endopeptidase MepM/ murein hydrolase activator NlpD
VSLDPKVPPVLEDDTLHNAGSRLSHGLSVTRHRARTRLDGRLPRLAAALVAAAGLGLAGIATATVSGPGGDDPAPLTAAQERARSAAADRGDRSDRDQPGGPIATSAAPGPDPSADPPTTEESDAPRSRGRATPEQPASSQEETKSAAPAQPQAEQSADWVHPMPGATVTSCYGMRGGVLHAGIDLAMPADTPIRAAGAGTVVEVGWVFAGYGISVVIDHGDGVLTHYAHQNSTAVEIGDEVDAGQVIGYEGSTGDSTGPHLHFEVHNGLWNQLDPAPWMREHGVDLGC